MKRILTTLFEKWPEYLIEGLVIVGSIVVAIELENWNDERKENTTRDNYLLLLQQDLNADVQHFDSLLNDLNRQNSLFDSIEAILKRPSSNAETFQKVMQDNLQLLAIKYEDANLNTSTYNNLQNSGNMSLLSPQLQKTLMDLHIEQEEYQAAITNNADVKKDLATYLVRTMPVHGTFLGMETNKQIEAFIWENTNWKQAIIPYYNALSANKLVLIYTLNSVESLKKVTVNALHLIKEPIK